jgi:hypothetical protein
MLMKRMKKFAEGGETEFTSQFKPERTDEGVSVKKSGGQSFNDAFREARKAGLKTFKWRGGTYGTKLAGEDAPAKKSAPAAEKEKPESDSDSAPTRRAAAPKGKLPRGYRPSVNAPTYGERVSSPFRRLGGDLFGLRGQEDIMRRTGVSRNEARDIAKKADRIRDSEWRGSSYKKGGSVKKYAKGGSVRGGGCEMKGKTKGKFV